MKKKLGSGDSIVLTVEGSQEDIDRLVSGIKSGALKEVSGYPVEDIQILSESSENDESNELNNKWHLIREIVTQGFKGQNLSGVDLSDADLSGINLSNANLSGADLSNTDLSRVDLSGANLSGADLNDADINQTNVEKARFSSNLGISESIKQDLIKRGAIFEDSPGDRPAPIAQRRSPS